MGRHAEKPRVWEKPGTGGKLFYAFAFKPPGATRSERITIPCGTASKREAERRMASAIEDWRARHPNGRKPAAPGTPSGERSLEKIWDLFLDHTKHDPDRKRPPSAAWLHILAQHGRLFAKKWSTVDAVTAEAVLTHKRDRLASGTKRTTLRHELFSLRLFMRWCMKRGIVEKVPPIELPARDDAEAVCLSPDEVHAILKEIPEYVEKGPTKGRPLRVFFEFEWWTGLRDRTVSLLAWDDYNQKTGELTVRAEIDKNRLHRTFKLFPEARAILDGMRPDIVPPGMFIFGPAKRWAPIKKAAIKAGIEKAEDVSEHTLRHSRTTDLCSRPNADLAAIAYLLGWRSTAMLHARYFHPTKRAADEFVDAIAKESKPA
jgi:site-specific recombinase XerD